MSETQIPPKKARRCGRPRKTNSNNNNGVAVNSGNVQAKEQRPRFQRTPLQEKLEEIISKCGLKSFDTDVEKCLYWGLEVRVRGLIRNLIRVSKKLADSEKSRSSVAVISDVPRQISQMTKMVGAESEEHPAEEDELTKLIEACKEKDYKIQMKEANSAVRAAVGGDDKVAKWQAMAEEQKHEKALVQKGHSDTAAAFDRRVRKVDVVTKPENRVISVKDVVSFLEREPQMAKSLFLYNLYERVGAKATVNNIPEVNRH